jgi:hypothetical protein
MSKQKSGSTAPSPLEHETIYMPRRSNDGETIAAPNLSNERGRLAREAATLSRDELVERAESAGVPTDGTKAEIVERVKDAARGD